ncbi:DUF4232 domain-containing protein [Streptomyces sp. NPDC007264]|uniref:DUF4232 domain-containing protein n=1 Tax=Streptomyces sp. NPDC007264 TaxID=3364777 RepID=UPI0036DD4344
MVIFRRGTAGPEPGGTAPSPTARRVASALGALAALSLLTACGDGHDASGGPEKPPGASQPPEASTTVDPTTGDRTAATGTAGTSAAATASGSTTSPAASTGGKGTRTRCRTSDLRATVGADNPGAGQENFPLVLTNRSGRTCTITGFPGAAFVDASGKQLGPDPRRSSGSPTKVTLAPGESAWAGLTFSNPEVSGARTASPASLLITPPDERTSLKVTWAGGAVPVSGNSSSVFLTVFSAGTGA